MPAKHRRASDGPELRNKAAHLVQSRPWLSLTTLASLAAIIPALIFVGGWLGGLIETPGSAQKREDKIRLDLTSNVATIYAEINKLRREFEDFKAGTARESAGVFLQLLENKVYVARNRANDCEIMRGKQTKAPMTAMETSACKQYDEDYIEARRRYELQQTSATQVWRTR